MKIVNVIVGVAGILVALAIWWGNRATDEANDLIKEGNAKFTLGKTLQNEGLEKLQAAEAASFPEQAEAIRKLANDGVELYTKSGESFRAAAAKFQSASETVHDSVLKEYFSMEHKSAAKLAELQDLFRKYLLIYADPTIQDAETLKQKTGELDEQATTLSNEFAALTEATKKYSEEHKSKLVDLE